MDADLCHKMARAGRGIFRVCGYQDLPRRSSRLPTRCCGRRSRRGRGDESRPGVGDAPAITPQLAESAEDPLSAGAVDHFGAARGAELGEDACHVAFHRGQGNEERRLPIVRPTARCFEEERVHEPRHVPVGAHAGQRVIGPAEPIEVQEIVRRSVMETGGVCASVPVAWGMMRKERSRMVWASSGDASEGYFPPEPGRNPAPLRA